MREMLDDSIHAVNSDASLKRQKLGRRKIPVPHPASLPQPFLKLDSPTGPVNSTASADERLVPIQSNRHGLSHTLIFLGQSNAACLVKRTKRLVLLNTSTHYPFLFAEGARSSGHLLWLNAVGILRSKLSAQVTGWYDKKYVGSVDNFYPRFTFLLRSWSWSHDTVYD
eukprot:scaffold48121_cov47-Attheya_sp.AAC.9